MAKPHCDSGSSKPAGGRIATTARSSACACGWVRVGRPGLSRRGLGPPRRSRFVFLLADGKASSNLSQITFTPHSADQRRGPSARAAFAKGDLQKTMQCLVGAPLAPGDALHAARLQASRSVGPVQPCPRKPLPLAWEEGSREESALAPSAADADIRTGATNADAPTGRLSRWSSSLP